VIKRYENRKLYDTENRRYVSLEEIGGLVRDGVDVQVVDNVSGQDITAQTLTQVILEAGKKGQNLLSKDILHKVIRWGNTLLDDGIEQVRHGLDQIVPQSLNRLFEHQEAHEIEDLKEKIDSLENMIEALGEHEIFGGPGQAQEHEGDIEKRSSSNPKGK